MDEHTSKIGTITRLEAFLYSCEATSQVDIPACTFGDCRKGHIPRRKLIGNQKSGGVFDSLKPQQKLIFESLQKAWYNELVYAQFVINEIILERKKFFLFKKVIKIKCPRGEHRGITRQKNVWIIVQFTQ